MARKYNYRVMENTRRCPHCNLLIAIASWDDHYFFCRRDNGVDKTVTVDPIAKAKMIRERQNELKRRRRMEQERVQNDIAEGERLMTSVLAAFTRQEVTEYPIEPSEGDDL